ncbi:sensor histidine kinase [Desulfitibacter alkalitolerans]|uniref:sensor histidine kinase n=1 Tax=Desulfitibacter alkalitolerans TaxID=264641 RepID=UPI001FA809FC|nr:sensor histidine kinase [Desulfitibacter alkalitolerans]
MAEYFSVLTPFYESVEIITPLKKGKEALIISSNPDKEAVIVDYYKYPLMSPPNIEDFTFYDYGDKKGIPLWLGTETIFGMVLVKEKKKSINLSLEVFKQYYIEHLSYNYPRGYLVPDGIILAGEDGSFSYLNYVGEYILRRLGINTQNLCGLFDGFGMGQCSKLKNSSGFFSFFVKLNSFDLIIMINPIIWRDKSLGSLIIISDISLIKKKENELIEKSTVVKEIHHRVKNNLQTITSLLRMQMRRSDSKFIQKTFNESINRILSIAIIHEALSKEDIECVNIKQTVYTIMNMIISNMVEPHKAILGELHGEDFYLSANYASYLSLCVTELIQNSIEHGFKNANRGLIKVSIIEKGQDFIISVSDNGSGFASGKTINESSLGMTIVNTITQQKLRGKFTVESSSKGTTATISFPKADAEEVE